MTARIIWNRQHRAGAVPPADLPVPVVEQSHAANSSQSRTTANLHSLSATSRSRRPPDLLTVIEANGFQDAWGFVLFRTDYQDQSQWERFKEHFDAIVDISIGPYRSNMTNIESPFGGLNILIIDDPTLAGASEDRIRR